MIIANVHNLTKLTHHPSSDSYAHLNSSLEKLAASLHSTNNDSFKPIKDFLAANYDNDPKKLSLLLRKGVYPYSYFDSMERFSETQLPSKTAFYNDLTQEPISSEDYQHVQDIWETFNLQTLGDLCDLYCKSDVLLLSCIIDRYRDTCLSIYGLDPVHYYTAPGLTWDAGLKYTKVELQLLQDNISNLW